MALSEERIEELAARYIAMLPERSRPKPVEAAKAKVVQLVTKTELSVEVQRERLDRERAELIAAEEREAQRAAEFRRMAEFHRSQSHAHDAAAKWAGEKIEVLEVDREGRAALAMRHDLETNERGLIEFDGGYRRTTVASEYNPMDGLRRRDDE